MEQGFCEEHWHTLMIAVAKKGMHHLIATDTDIWQVRLGAYKRRGSTGIGLSEFDPLINTAHVIIEQLYDVVGPWDGCATCYLLAEHKVQCDDLDCDLVDAMSIADAAAGLSRAKWMTFQN